MGRTELCSRKQSGHGELLMLSFLVCTTGSKTCLTGFNPLPATNYPRGSFAPKLGSLPSTGVERGDENTHDRSLGEARLPASVRPGHLTGQPVLVSGANTVA